MAVWQVDSRLAVLLAAVCVGLTTAPARAGIFGSEYTEVGRCGTYARVAVRTPSWLCLGIVAGRQQGIIRPRAIIETAPHSFIVTDMYGWGDDGRRGRVLRLDLAPDGTVRVSVIFAGLTLPHGLARGPDGLVYVAEADRIWRFDPAPDKPQQDLVLKDLPTVTDGDDRHPLKNIIFDAAGALIVSVGAPSDRCEAVPGDFATVQRPCNLTDSDPHPRGALWRISFDKPGGRVISVEPFARGLRNSMALAVHPRSGLLLQGENSLDIFAATAALDPPDELNIIVPSHHYGWPYCTGANIVTPDYARDNVDCRKFTPPAALLPPHASPLGMSYYAGAMFPELAGKLIIAFHSLNQHPGNGRHIAAYDTQVDGRPIAASAAHPLMLVDDWAERPGLRPQGTPVGITVAGDGSVWFVEDVNQTIMVLLRP